jgi:hypothetical protein
MSINDNKSVSLYYFIGRLNPPHNGHISALIQLIEMAKGSNSVPLILLGNGPKTGNPLDNPISFELKERFINYKLSEKGFTEGKDYVIKEMTSPASNVSEFISVSLETMHHDLHLDSIKIIHVAGGKDEDASKLDFIKKFAFNAAFEIKPDTGSITVATEAIEPVTVEGGEMSATRVRKDAYKNFLNGKGLEGFLSEKNGLYASFFGTMAQEIYQGIIAPAQSMNKINIEAYLDPSIKLQPTTKRARLIKGGKHVYNKTGKKKYNIYKRKTRKQTNKRKNRTGKRKNKSRQ